MSEAKVDLTVQDSGAVSAWDRYRAALEAVLNVDRQRASEDKKAAQAAAELGRIKSRVLGEIESASDRYAKRLDELQRLDHAGVISAQEFARAHAQAKQQLDAANPAIAQAAERQRELARAAQQVARAVLTPFEQYRQRVAGLKEQLAAGLITQEQYTRAVRQSREELVKGSGKIDERKRKEQELAALQHRVLESIVTPQERYNRQLQTLSMLRQRNKLDEDQYARAVAHAEHQLDESVQSGTSGLERMALKYLSITVALGTVKSGVQWWMNANKELLDQANEIGNKYDEAFRKIRVQGALGQLEGKEAQTKILDLAEKNAVDMDSSTKTAQQLMSSGFSVDDSTGGALDISLQAFNAGNLRAQDPTQLTQSFGQFLAATGQEKNTGNLKRLAVGTQRLFEGTDLQVSDLSQLASKAQGAAGRMSQEEILATFNVMRQKTTADKASTGFEIFTNRLMGAKEDKERRDVLKRMKLKPEDVDFKGEDVQQVLEKLAGGLEQVPEESREGLLQKLFGTEVSSKVSGLIRDRGDIQKYIEMQRDEAGFAKAADANSSGRAAADRVLKLQEERAILERDDQGDLSRRALKVESLKSGRSALYTDALLKGTDAARYLGSGLGVSPDTASTVGMSLVETAVDPRSYLGTLGSGLKMLGIGNSATNSAGELLNRAGQRRDAAFGPEGRDPVVDELKKQNKLVEEQNQLLKSQPRPNTLPTGTRPAAALANKP